MTSLIITVMLFLPNWSADMPNKNVIQISRTNGGNYQSLSECRENLTAVKDVIGVYKLIYPQELEYHMSLNMECTPAEEI